MKLYSRHLIVSIIFSCLCSNDLFASGFQIFEMGTGIIGTAAVGQATTFDASTSYFNSAAMTKLRDSQAQLASQLFITQIKFRPNRYNTFSGSSGRNAGGILSGMSFFGVFDYNEDIKFGLSVTSPFGGLVAYNDGWVGRYFNQGADLLTLDLNPSVAYKIHDCLSVGVGLFVEYATLENTSAVPILSPGDGQADVNAHSYAPGANLGLLWTPVCGTNIGIAYRSRVNHHLKGNLSFLRLDLIPAVSVIIKTPQSVISSFSQEIAPDFTLLGEVAWVNWKVFKNTDVQIAGITLPTPKNWKNTYRLGIGGHYLVCENWIAKGGVSYDSSPCNERERLPNLPVDKQWRIGTGLLYKTCENVELGLDYEYISFGKASIFNATRLGTLSGHYVRNRGQVFAIHMNIGL
jgi:long-chain fatty acid transport protein